jgi:hypothetical protein
MVRNACHVGIFGRHVGILEVHVGKIGVHVGKNSSHVGIMNFASENSYPQSHPTKKLPVLPVAPFKVSNHTKAKENL